MCARIVRPLLTKAVAKVTCMATSHTWGKAQAKATAQPGQPGQGVTSLNTCVKVLGYPYFDVLDQLPTDVSVAKAMWVS